uniref:Uncharacterized protein n=1 Tax=Octopus bimaculoides TaxID=37653 RepID=A0A0L8HGH4_OCTBM
MAFAQYDLRYLVQDHALMQDNKDCSLHPQYSHAFEQCTHLLVEYLPMFSLLSCLKKNISFLYLGLNFELFGFKTNPRSL